MVESSSSRLHRFQCTVASYAEVRCITPVVSVAVEFRTLKRNGKGFFGKLNVLQPIPVLSQSTVQCLLHVGKSGRTAKNKIVILRFSL